MKKSILLLSALAIIALLVESCSIRPIAWTPDQKPSFSGVTALNEKLNSIEKISLQGWYGPEDIVFDSTGNLYCGVHIGEDDFSDGRILKITPSGQVEEFYNAGSWVAGLHFDAHGNLIALSHKLGLISISAEREVTVLANKDEKGNPFLIPNGLDIASDGKIYFSNTSDESAYTIKYGRKIVLEMSAIGGFYCYDPATKKVKTLIDGTYFGNGVVLSKDESFVLMTETTKYRVLRYWLKGDKAGQTDVFADNLPGFPNGISIREDGSYWLGFSTKRNDALDKIHPSPTMKKLVYVLPNFLQPKAELFGIILNLSPEGHVINALYDTTGIYTPETGAVKEHDGHLFIGGDVVPYIAKYKIEETPINMEEKVSMTLGKEPSSYVTE
jgi:sugar lactone lactonase YvrE